MTQRATQTLDLATKGATILAIVASWAWAIAQINATGAATAAQVKAVHELLVETRGTVSILATQISDLSGRVRVLEHQLNRPIAALGKGPSADGERP